MGKYYRLIAEFATEEQAKTAQDILNNYFHCDELLWNIYKEINN
jgi:hypothetical protein